ncbi:tetratricopeptide repeat protein [Brevibacillus daliensis]|uniref:tetratricopeptide repeat protein n=1 Tax=Brevibacillus daliensis TaxID=2892995 RepID=UPI001E3DD324|nr:tetratricopeptide repeat protein [Brevibacillus daliensis]
MQYFQLTPPATIAGIVAVLLMALIKLQWPFRFQYMTLFHKKTPERIKKCLEASFLKNNKRTVALLDKSSQQILAGEYDDAEKYITQAIVMCKQTPTLFHRALLHHLFYNLAVAYYYRGRYKEALQIAAHLYQRDNKFQNALGIMVCCHARMGDSQGAFYAFSLLKRRRLRPALLHYCLAELEAAQGKYSNALNHLEKIGNYAYSHTLFLHQAQFDRRLKEWTKESSHAG